MARRKGWRWPNRRTRPVVIFVDDDELLTNGFCRDLELHYDYEMWPCYNTRDALGRAQQLGALVSVIVMDIVLGMDDGKRVAELMLVRCPNAKVLYISGDPTALETIPEPGLPKPFLARDLDLAIRALVIGNGV